MTANIEEMKKKIGEMFPMDLPNGDILYLSNIDCTYLINRKSRKYNLDIFDNNGYKYYLTFENVKAAKKGKLELNKFFKRNRYTFDNINNYCRINNLDIRLVDEIPNSNAAREMFKYIKSSGETILTSWNDIQHYSFRYTYGYKSYIRGKKHAHYISKEDAIKTIYEMQANKDTPIDNSDFRVKKDNCVGARTIVRYWGTVQNMQRELGLTYTAYKNKLTKEEYEKEIYDACNQVYQTENRKIIMYSDIKKYGSCEVNTYRRYCEENNTTLNNLIDSFGFSLQRAGNGLNYSFDDGEKVLSKYEFEFSNYLRDIGLAYNKDYFRSVLYKTIDDEYKGNMNCDYLLKLNGNDIYIEIAGVLGNVTYENAYRDNIQIKSKSKEKYRLGLIKKKNILERNSLKYYIFLRTDMINQSYKEILSNHIEKEQVRKVG